MPCCGGGHSRTNGPIPGCAGGPSGTNGPVRASPGRRGRLLLPHRWPTPDRPIGGGELVDAICSQDPPGDPADAIAALLSKVRTALSNRWLEGRSRIPLMLPPHAEVDVERALAAVHQAESACALADWPRAWTASLAAQNIAKRTLLGEYEDPWIETWRRRLDEVMVSALECYARSCLGLV